MSKAELAFIAETDYGQNSQQHYEALYTLIHKQDGIITDQQYWFPYEVIELCSHGIKQGHEREFAICTLLIIQNVIAGTDPATDLLVKFQTCAEDYDLLPEELREEILNAYLAAMA